jgi:hypothetical protein
VLIEIRDGISNLAGSRPHQISEIIDIDHIKQQHANAAYGWDNCTKLITDVMGTIQRLQQSSRNEETAQRWEPVRTSMMLGTPSPEEQPAIFCRALEFVLDRVNAMRIDMVNARMRFIAPVIKDHGVTYERDKFQAMLDEGKLTLEHTTAWINASVGGLSDEKRQVLSTGSPSAYVDLHRQAVLSLVVGALPPIVVQLPETFRHDKHRFASFRKEYTWIVNAVSIVVTVANITKSRKTVDAVVDHLLLQFAVDTNIVDNEDDRVIDVEAVHDIIVGASPSLKAMLSIVVTNTNAVNKTVAVRVTNVLLTNNNNAGDDNDAPPPPFIALAMKLRPLIDALSRKIDNITVINRTVYMATYNRLIADACVRASM